MGHQVNSATVRCGAVRPFDVVSSLEATALSYARVHRQRVAVFSRTEAY